LASIVVAGAESASSMRANVDSRSPTSIYAQEVASIACPM
jgi:hypothetical protein